MAAFTGLIINRGRFERIYIGAPIIWDALGDVDNYIEPFFGSGAVLIAR